MEGIELNKGSIEIIAVDVTDRGGNLLTLVGANPRYHFRKLGATSYIVTDGVPNIDLDRPMVAECLVDTTNLDGEYELFLSFTVVPQIPRLGPFRFFVNA
jgi:hypothetical protein